MRDDGSNTVTSWISAKMAAINPGLPTIEKLVVFFLLCLMSVFLSRVCFAFGSRRHSVFSAYEDEPDAVVEMVPLRAAVAELDGPAAGRRQPRSRAE